MTEKTKELMTHLVVNYPNPESFKQALEATLDAEVDFLELQIPFTNPVADGPVIYEANQAALKYGGDIAENLTKISEFIKNYQTKKPLKTKLFLMTYFTPAISFGIKNLADLMIETGFSGIIIPDLGVDAPEHKELSEIAKNTDLQLIPVISPRTSLERLEKIKNRLKQGQIVYGVARAGKTGKGTSMEDPEILKYLEFLETNLEGYKIAVGFGIKDRGQVEFLNKKGFIAVIGSEIVRRVRQNHEEGNSVSENIKKYLEKVQS